MKEKILETLKAHLLTNKEFISAEEIESLETQIHHMEKEVIKEKASAYAKQLRAFRDHMNRSFDVLMDCELNDGSWDVFYRSDFTLTWRGKTVTLGNGAEVWQSLEEIIDTELEYYEEV